MRTWVKLLLALGIFAAGNFLFAAILATGMARFYGLSKRSELLILGHSHVMLALNEAMLERRLNIRVSKYTREGVSVAERDLMAEQYLRGGSSDGLRCVVYGVDPWLFTASGLSSNSLVNFYPMLDDPVIAPYLRENMENGEYCKMRLFPLCRFQDAAINAGIAGWVRQGKASFKFGRVDIEQVRRDIRLGRFRRIGIDPESVKIFRRTIRRFTKRGIRVILLNTPIVDLLNEAEPTVRDEVDKIFRSVASDPLVEYWDLNSEYGHEYALFRDQIHLNRVGQEAVTRNIGEKLCHEVFAH